MKKYEKVKEAMERTGFSRNTLMKFDRPGITIRVGRTVRFDCDALDKALAESTEGIQAEQGELVNA
ncbi:hypothetical protein [Butyrivibrio proteoclasticus]|uniref:hypothetical protein n=1 Tax=Butyrivibrio proteoclasticus TaxID=43305 RepID=UPI00047CA08C|nr:hypothetical protein [Butyrivibrio proteoclasticus]